MPYNPFSGWRVTNDWAGHMSYSAGGTDYPLPYNTPLPAPASGRLYTAGQAGGFRGFEFACGWVGSAGRRSILILDQPIGDVVAVVFQHQASFGSNGTWHAEGAVVGRSGASANGVDWGGDVHLHIHCLTASGQRRDFTKYFSGSRPAGGDDRTPIEEDDMFEQQDRNDLAELKRLASNIAGFMYAGGPSVDSGQRTRDFHPKSAMGRLDNLEAAIFRGGISMQDGGKSISQSLAEISAKAGAELTDEQIDRIAEQVNQSSAELIAAVVNEAVADDFEALRAALAQLPDEFRENLKAAL